MQEKIDLYLTFPDYFSTLRSSFNTLKLFVFSLFSKKPNEEIDNEQKGFYISFDNSQPKRPKPPLRTKRSPKKDLSLDSTDRKEQNSQMEQELNVDRQGNISTRKI